MVTDSHLEYLRVWSYDLHDRSSVWDGVGQHVPHRAVCFKDGCLIGIQCFPLSFAQRHSFFILQIWSEKIRQQMGLSKDTQMTDPDLGLGGMCMEVPRSYTSWDGTETS